MSFLDKASIADLAAIYAVSNTPAYFYRHIREHPVIRALSGGYSVASIVERLKAILSGEINSLEDAIEAYALVFALTYKDYGEVRGPLNEMQIEKLEWGVAIRALYESQVIPVSIIRFGGRMSRPSALGSSSSSTAVSGVRLLDHKGHPL